MIKNKKTVIDPFLLQSGENWLNRTWRPMAAIVYLLICLFDFIVAPSWSGMHTPTAAQLALAAKGLDPQVGAILVASKEQWQPLTLQGGGLFHVAFGAILGVAAWTRGAAQIEQLKQRGESVRSPNTDYPYDIQFNSQDLDIPDHNKTDGNDKKKLAIDNPDEEK